MAVDEFNFEGEEQTGSWDILAAHHEKGAIYVVNDILKLSEVATAMAKDDVALVKEWLGQSLLCRPSAEQVALWEKSPHRKMATFTIVSPYVLIQLLFDA